MNILMFYEWYRIMDRSSCYFVDLFMTSQSMNPTSEEIAQFRRTTLLISDPDRILPPKPVVMIICRHEHYFVAYFDYSCNCAWVIGHDAVVQRGVMSTAVAWDAWGGHQYWNRVRSLLGWNRSSHVSNDPHPRVNAWDFPQVGIQNPVSTRRYLMDSACEPERHGLWTNSGVHRSLSSEARV